MLSIQKHQSGCATIINMKFSEELKWRGLVGLTTIENLSDLDKPGRTFYIGADPSADSMTIGNLAALILCMRFIKAGHKGIVLAGGATAMAGGDPDGKDETRAKIEIDTINDRVEKFKTQYRQIFRDLDITIVNNYDWFKEIKYIDFLRDIGWNFSMTQLLDRDFVKKRIGEGGKGINYAEFSYSLIQGYDFLHLYRQYGVTLQLCGVDQFGNSTSGMHLIGKVEGVRADVFGMPLVINKSTGKKFGKSEAGAVWLDTNKTSVYQFYQFWLNTDDAGVIDYLKIYTFLDKEEIDQIEARQRTNPGERLAQRRLAEEVTKIVHGEEALAKVQRVTETLFGGQSINDLSSDELELLAAEIPTVELSGELTVIDALVGSGVVPSRGEARRLIQGGAISVNGCKVDADESIKSVSLIKRGRNQFVLVK